MWTYNYTYSDELYHHGIKGMKWGVRRFQNKDGTRTAAGKKRYANDTSKDNKEENSNADQTKQKKGLTDKQKKAIKVGAIVAGTALAAYGSYKIYQAYTGSNQEIDPDTGFRLLNKDMTTQQHLDAINPGRIRFFNRSYKNKEIISGSSANCMLCTTAYDLRQRGYDVHAGKSWTGFMPDDLFGRIYKDYEGTTKIKPGNNPSESFSKIVNKLQEEGPGSRGNIVVWWSGNFSGGHSMIWENIDGHIKFMDGQTGREYKDFTNQILNSIDSLKPIELLRTDNLEIWKGETHRLMNTDTTFKTYVDNGAQIAVRLSTDPRIAIPAYTAATAASSIKMGTTSYKRKKVNANG